MLPPDQHFFGYASENIDERTYVNGVKKKVIIYTDKRKKEVKEIISLEEFRRRYPL